MQNSRKAGGEAGQRGVKQASGNSGLGLSLAAQDHTAATRSCQSQIPRVSDSQRFPESQLVGGLSSKVLRV